MASHRQPTKDPTPWRFGLAIAVVIFICVAACFAVTVVVLFNGDPSVQPAIHNGVSSSPVQALIQSW